MKQNRDNSIDIMRTIGIVAVVGYHCGLYPRVFGLFHNPLFMFVAGMFHPVNCCQTGKEYLTFVLKKVCKIYIPFVIITLFLTVFQPLLSHSHLADTAPYTLSEMPIKILTVFAMRVESINGPSWFLISYLEVSLFFELLRLLFCKAKITYDKFLLPLIGVLLFPIGVNYDFPRCLDESAILFLWYCLGFIMRPLHDAFREWMNHVTSQKRVILQSMLLILIGGGYIPNIIYNIKKQS